jgi:coniferyl-aldehyde dehydrogenase
MNFRPCWPIFLLAAKGKDRMQRAINLLVENGAALSDDFGHRSREQSMLADIVGPIPTFKHAIKHVDR